MDDRSVSLNYYLSKEYRDPPKAFWKYYDLYRRKQITLDEYAVMTGLAPSAICRYLAAITEKKPKTLKDIAKYAMLYLYNYMEGWKCGFLII